MTQIMLNRRLGSIIFLIGPLNASVALRLPLEGSFFASAAFGTGVAFALGTVLSGARPTTYPPGHLSMVERTDKWIN